MTKATQLLGFFERYNMLKTIILVVILTLLLLFFLGWPGCLLAALIGGFFIRGFGRAALIGFVGGLIAWIIPVGFNLGMGAGASIALFASIAGMGDFASVLVVVVLLIGGLLGLVGCLLGNTIYTLAEPQIQKYVATAGVHAPPKKKAPKKSAR